MHAKRSFSLLAALSFLTAVPPAHADVDRGMPAYTAGDFETAARELEASAKEGDRLSKYHLGLLYEEPVNLNTLEINYQSRWAFTLDNSQINPTFAGDNWTRGVEVKLGWHF